MPDAAPPVSRYRRSLSHSSYKAAVLDIFYNVSTSSVVPLQSSSCLSPDPVTPGLFLPRSRPCLLDKAAEGGLEPAPASRFRGADPHQLNSCAPPRPFGRLLCSWHTVTAISEKSIGMHELSAVPVAEWLRQVTSVQRYADIYPAVRHFLWLPRSFPHLADCRCLQMPGYFTEHETNKWIV